jgi:hypothetical protein
LTARPVSEADRSEASERDDQQDEQPEGNGAISGWRPGAAMGVL